MASLLDTSQPHAVSSQLYSPPSNEAWLFVMWQSSMSPLQPKIPPPKSTVFRLAKQSEVVKPDGSVSALTVAGLGRSESASAALVDVPNAAGE